VFPFLHVRGNETPQADEKIREVCFKTWLHTGRAINLRNVLYLVDLHDATIRCCHRSNHRYVGAVYNFAVIHRVVRFVS
jgi:hypothetical protein